MNLLRQHLFIVLGGVVISIVILSMLLLFVFPGTIVLPQMFTIGPIHLRAYGIILATAVLFGYFFARKRIEQYGLTILVAENIVLTMLVTGFIGARLYHVLSDYELYHNNLFGVLAVWNGGLSIFGAIIGGFIGLVGAAYVNGMRERLLSVLDWIAPSIAISQAIGRFGNLFNYEAYGLPTLLPWKMFVPPQFRIPPYEQFQFFHPLFLYESIGSLLIAVALLYWSNRYIRRPGYIFGIWLSGYGAIRLLTELLRLDKHLVLELPLNLFIAAGFVIAGVLFVHLSKKYSTTHEESIIT